MSYDPTIYRGTAAYYTRGRPPYARTLAATLAAELGLDRRGSTADSPRSDLRDHRSVPRRAPPRRAGVRATTWGAVRGNVCANQVRRATPDICPWSPRHRPEH